MPIKTTEKVILGCDDDGNEVEVRYHGTNLPADKANSIAAKMIKIFAPTIGKVLNGTKSLTDLMSGDVGSINMDFGEIAAALMEQLDESVIQGVIKDLMSGPIVRYGPSASGKPVKQDLSQRSIFNDVFAGNQMELLRVLRFALEINFPRFFSENRIGEVWDRGRAMMDRASAQSSKSESPMPSATS